MNRKQLLDIGQLVLISALFLVTIWTLSVTWLWVTLGVALFLASIDFFIRKDRAGQANRQ